MQKGKFKLAPAQDIYLVETCQILPVSSTFSSCRYKRWAWSYTSWLWEVIQCDSGLGEHSLNRVQAWDYSENEMSLDKSGSGQHFSKVTEKWVGSGEGKL